ncbi:MAG: DUF881 domain-containing protein [Clostridiales bacterium]|nr:DUF881 domain-containing protein [Clostridiales bacterium]MBF0988016.1 DUF881 domain-containing protein [Clostridiales bacterium]MBF0988703.1 DUF881 domain-containing protein [Clostridiales bacterium]
MKTIKNKWSLTIIIGIVAALLVTSILLQFKTVDETTNADVEGLRDTELKSQISSYKSKYNEVASQYQNNIAKIEEYTKSATTSTESTNLIKSEYQKSNELLGLTDVKGEGIIITLKDVGENKYSSEDLRSLVNELKYAGAEAISINGNRIINLTDIVTLNEKFIIMDASRARLSSPYVIKAIGDRKYLSSTLNTKTTGFVDLMKSNGLEVTIEESNKIEIDKYQGEIKSNYLKEEK